MSAVQTDNNLSFLDTLSCGLGAVMVLFFLFAAISDRGVAGPKVRPVVAQSDMEQTVVFDSGRDKSKVPMLYLLRLSQNSCQLSTQALSDVADGKLSLGRSAAVDKAEYYAMEWDYQPLSIEFVCGISTDPLIVSATLLSDAPTSTCALVSLNARGTYEVKLQFAKRTVVLNGAKSSEEVHSACSA